MDQDRFDDLARSLTTATPRRSAVRGLAGALLAGLFGWHGDQDAEAHNEREKCKKINDKDKRQRCVEQAEEHKKKHKKKSERCGPATCSSGTFCCDDARGVCCASGSECCNLGPGTGSCCASPNRCGRPYGNDAAPNECCPPERQWFTATGLVRCCPAGTRSLGTGITADDGPCCPEEKFCGDTCCPNLAPICIDPATRRCCTAEGRCGSNCCSTQSGETCCGGTTCCSTGRCFDCNNGSCVYRCAENEFCNRNGVCDSCGQFGCGG